MWRLIYLHNSRSNRKCAQSRSVWVVFPTQPVTYFGVLPLTENYEPQLIWLWPKCMSQITALPVLWWDQVMFLHSRFPPQVISYRNDLLSLPDGLSKHMDFSSGESKYHFQIKSVPKALVPENWVTGYDRVFKKLCVLYIINLNLAQTRTDPNLLSSKTKTHTQGDRRWAQSPSLENAWWAPRTYESIDYCS